MASLAETAELAVRLTLDDRMSPALRKTQTGLRSIGSAAKTAGKAIAVGVGAAAVIGIGLLTNAIKSGIDALKQDKVVAAQTAAVLKSTGGAAGVTAKQVDDLAQQLSVLDGIQDNVVQGAENVILRFTNIGADVFPQVTAAALDMAAATGGDASQAALKLSRALDNPVKGLTALTRLGITFTDQQTKQIQSLVKSNRLREAQAIILGQVEKRFKGVAEQQANADPSRRLAVSTERFQKALASGILPVVEKVQTRLAEWFIKPETIAAVTKLGDTIGGLFTDQNLDAVASGLETAANAVGVAINAFNQLPGPIKALAIGAFAINKVTGGAVGGIASAFGKVLGAGLQKIFAANVTVIGGNISGGAGGIAGAAGGGTAGKVLGVAAIATAIVGVVAAQQEISAQSTAQGRALQQQLAAGISVKTPEQLQTALNGVRQGIHDIQSNPLNVLVQGDALNSLKSMEAALVEQQNLRGIESHNAAERRDVLPDNKAVVKHLATIGIDLNKIAGISQSTAKATNAVRAHIDIERNRLASLQRQLHAATEAHDSRRAAQLRGKIDRVKGNIDRSNVHLRAIQAKDWHVTVPITNQISVRDYQTGSSSYNRVATHTTLASR